MKRDWESIFRSWAQPPGKTEQERCENAENSIRNAINKSDKLKMRNIKVFTQGSYRNNTNVRKDSDVDIGILCKDTFFYDLPEGYSKDNFSIAPATYHYAQFKNEVEEALVSYFGRSAVTRGNKAFDIKETTYHVEADVAPFFEHRRYHKNGQFISGVELLPDNGGRIINWPEQHYENGVTKNKATGKRFKGLVRVLKALCNDMQDNNIGSAKDIPGFLIECLVWNVSNNNFGNPTYKEDLQNILTFLIRNTNNDDKCKEWGEVSELKYLFRSSQKWNRQQAHAFLLDALRYIEME